MLRVDGTPVDVAGQVLKFDAAASPQWLHVTALEDWFVLPTTAMSPLHFASAYRSLGDHGLVLLQTAPPEPLLMYALRSKTSLTHADLVKLAVHLGLRATSSEARADLLRRIASHVSCESPCYVEAVLQVDEATAKDNLDALAANPLLEAAYDELEDVVGE